MDRALVRTFRCGQCGASQEVLRDGLVMVCERCGVFVALQVERYYSPEALRDQIEQARLRAALPTEIEARHTVAIHEMTAASNAGDRGAYRLWAREYHAMTAQLTPHVAGSDLDTPERFRMWLERGVLAGELAAFEPSARAARDEVTAAVMRLYQDADKVGVARAIVASSTAMYAVLAQHPDYAAVSPNEQPERQAEEYLRMVLATGESALGKDVVAAIRTEVLGDTRADQHIDCGSCGARVELSPGLVLCPYCGGQLGATDLKTPESAVMVEPDPIGHEAIGRSSQSAWVAQTMATYKMATHDDPGATAVQQILMPFFMGSAIPAEWAVAFLEALSPRPALERIHEHASLMLQVRDDARAVLVAVMNWCDDAARHGER